MQSPNSIMQAAMLYQGIQGMYFLNKSGDIGYITSDSSRAVRESFPQLNDKEFLKKHPDFLEQIEGFLRMTAELPGGYLDPNNARDIELGYIVPPGDDQPWESSNLVIHRHVLESICNDDKMLRARSSRLPASYENGTPDENRYQVVRSVYQGFAYLLYHKNAFGICQYFPVLYKLPGYDLISKAPQAKAPLRVLNLKWSGGDVVRAAEKYARFPAVFSILRANMVKRGAIIRNDSKPIAAVS